MPELVTLGETMAVFIPTSNEPLRYVSDFRMRIAGAESNLAIGINKLEHSAGWISRLGEDEFGHFILNRVRSEGVDTSQVKFDKSHRSGIMFKDNYSAETKVYYYRDNSAASCLSPEDIDSSYISGAKILHITGITPILSESCSMAVDKAVNIAKRNNILLSFDPNIRLKLWGKKDNTQLIMELLTQSDIVLIGVSEAKMLLKTDNVNEIFTQISKVSQAKYIALKDGKNGAWVGTGDTIYHSPPQNSKHVDSVGAGDAFNAGFLTGLLEGQPIEICGRMGNIMGGCATQTLGDVEGLPSKEDLMHYLTDTQVIYR